MGTNNCSKMTINALNQIISHLKQRNLLNSFLLFKLSGLHFASHMPTNALLSINILCQNLEPIFQKPFLIYTALPLMAAAGNTSRWKQKKENLESNYTCGRGRYQITASHLYAAERTNSNSR